MVPDTSSVDEQITLQNDAIAKENKMDGIYNATFLDGNNNYALSRLTFIVPYEVNNMNARIICFTGTSNEPKSCSFQIEGIYMYMYI